MRAPEKKEALLVFDHFSQLILLLIVVFWRSKHPLLPFRKKNIFAGKSFSAIGPTFATKNRSAVTVFALGR